MKKKILMLCMGCFLVSLTAKAQWVVSDPGNLAQGIINAAKNYDPARMTHYLMDLATLFHKFYNACRVQGEDEALMQARISLCLATRVVLANLLKLLKINAPQSM